MTKLGSCLMSGDYSIDPNIMNQCENKDSKQVRTYIKFAMVKVSVLTGCCCIKPSLPRIRFVWHLGYSFVGRIWKDSKASYV